MALCNYYDFIAKDEPKRHSVSNDSITNMEQVSQVAKKKNAVAL